MEKIKKTQKTVSKEYCYMFLIGMYLLSMLLSFLFYGGLGSSLKKAYQVGLFSCVFLLPLWLLFYQIEWELKNKKRVLTKQKRFDKMFKSPQKRREQNMNLDN